MRMISIPSTNLRASAICLGTGDLGSTVSQPESFRLLDAFADHGGNFLDSALIYADWLPIERSASEKTIGRWLKRRRNRSRMVVGTKGAHPSLATMHIPRLSKGEILSDLEQSLHNLQTDCIDLYWLHRDDPARPVGEIVETLNEAARAGKLRFFGCSNWRRGRIEAAQVYAAQTGLQGFSADQMLWSLAAIDSQAVEDKTLALMDEELRAYHAASGLAAVPYSSQANGLFRKMAQGSLEGLSPQQQRMYAGPENERRFARLRRLAGELSLTLTQVALAYLASQPFPTLPIIGSRRMADLLDSLGAGEVQLTAEQVRYLERGE